MRVKHQISRRGFLKLSGATALSFAMTPRVSIEASPLAQTETPIGLGRATRWLNALEEPNFTAKKLKSIRTDTVLNLYEEKTGEAETAHNTVWYRADEGWLYSGYVQPVKNELNKPVAVKDIPPKGFLAETTVPVTEAWHNNGGKPTIAYRFYYSTTHWVDQAITDKKGITWYRVLDDRYLIYYYVRAEHLRRVVAEELTALSPTVTDKRIEVDLKQQTLTAFENGALVFKARVATGRTGSVTPTGEFRVERKRPSRHMAATDGNGFDLPGVPWVAYIFWTGVAFHGTYWHNDYGTPRSRGCINLTPAEAKWVYRWTTPSVPFEEQSLKDKNGTQVIIF